MFFFCREQIQQRDAGDVLWRSSYVVFLWKRFLLKQIAIHPQIYLSAPRRIAPLRRVNYRPAVNDTWRDPKHSAIMWYKSRNLYGLTPLLSLARQAKKSSRSKRSLKAIANHSLKILFRINHHTGAWVHWQCKSSLYTLRNLLEWTLGVVACQMEWMFLQCLLLCIWKQFNPNPNYFKDVAPF